MKQLADKKRSEREFEAGDWVFMKLHAYAQHSMQKRGAREKLQSKWFGPFQILEKIGIVAYKLDLPAETLIHTTVHVSQLKLAHGVTNQANPLSSEFRRTQA